VVLATEAPGALRELDAGVPNIGVDHLVGHIRHNDSDLRPEDFELDEFIH
jgi:hypothetical protein